jgi:hypothetical protein
VASATVGMAAVPERTRLLVLSAAARGDLI